jgi:hypothetical protein
MKTGIHAFFPHRAWAARRADALRWAGLSLPLSVAAPLRPPRRPMAAITWEITAWFGVAASPPVLRLTTSAANWFMSWD